MRFRWRESPRSRRCAGARSPARCGTASGQKWGSGLQVGMRTVPSKGGQRRHAPLAALRSELEGRTALAPPPAPAAE